MIRLRPESEPRRAGTRLAGERESELRPTTCRPARPSVVGVNEERIEMTQVLTNGAADAPSSDRPPVLVAARDVTRRYGAGETAVDALRGVSLAVSAGELTAVMGPSGSGKSTLMHILAGLDRPDSGTVTIDGTEITALGDDALTRLRREHVGFVFQFFNLLPMLTAEENIVLPLSIAGTKPE